MSLAILYHFLCAQHVSDINISVIRSLRLCCWITTLVVLFLVRCVLEIWCSWVGVASACNTDTTPTQLHLISNTHRTKNNTTNVVIQQHSRKLLMTDILMSETCWAHKKWNKIASDIKLVFYSSTYFKLYNFHITKSKHTILTIWNSKLSWQCICVRSFKMRQFNSHEHKRKRSKYLARMFYVIHIPCNGLITQHLTQQIKKLITVNHLSLISLLHIWTSKRE